jgi:hypothetical protein
MGRRLISRFAPLLAALSFLGPRLGAQVPNVDSIVEKALTENAGAQGGTLIGTVMSDTGVQRAMHDRATARQVSAAVKEFARSFRNGGDGEDPQAARQTFLAAIKKATGRDLSKTQYAGTMIHVPAVDVDVPSVHVHTRAMDVPVPPMPPIPPIPAIPALPSAPASTTLTAAQKALVDRARHDPGASSLPALSAFTAGTRVVTGEIQGDVATVNGTLQIEGTVDGDAAAVAGNVVLMPGAIVHGNATAIGGEVQLNGGTVNGEVRSTGGPIGPVATTAATAGHGAHHELRLSLAFLALMLVIGIGVLTFASDPLDAAAQAVAEQFGRALGYGVAGALGVLPLLVVVIVAVCITVVGLLVLPVVVLGYALAVLGISLVGFFAVAQSTGQAIYRHRQAMDPLSERGAKLRAIVTGVSIYGGLWVIAALLGGLPVVGVVLHVLASAITTIVLLVGIGAVLVSRRDARTGRMMTEQVGHGASTAAPPLWQTPTPVGGVAAARRPTPPPPSGAAS